jgi:hypothetical protein
MKAMFVKVYFFENILATSPNNTEIMSDHVIKKECPEANRTEELKAMEELLADPEFNELMEKQMTVFPRTKKGDPMFWNYQWKGYMKEKCSFIKKNDTKSLTSVTSSLTPVVTDETMQECIAEAEAEAEKKKSKARSKKTKDDIDREKPISASIKAFKKEIDGNIFVLPRKILIHTDDDITVCQRPLRASTQQGDRVALSASEEIHGGAWCEFTVECHIEDRVDAVREWLDYGRLHGTGQWRNSGMGTFLWAELDAPGGKQFGGNYTPELYKMFRDAAEL